MRKTILAILFALVPVLAGAQTLPIDPITEQPFPDLTASCPNQVAAGQTLAVTSSAEYDCLAVKGTLAVTANANQTLTFRYGTILGYPGCTITLTATASGALLDVVGKNIAPTDPLQYGTGVLGLGCRLRWNGRPLTTITRVTAELTAGQTVIPVENTSGWWVGMLIVLTDSREREETVVAAPGVYTVKAFTPTSVTVDRPLEIEHPAQRDANGTIEAYPHVGVLSRSIRFRAENPAGWRPHLLISSDSDSVIEYVEFTDCGRTTLDPASQVGRYCDHHHHQTGPFRDTGISVWNTPKWGPTIHLSHNGIIEDSFVYNAGGAGIMTEMSNESGNLIRRNLVVQSSGGGRTDSRFPPGGVTNTCFWIGPLNRVVSNYAYNCMQGYAVFGATTNFATLTQFDDNEAWGNWTSFECWECLGGGTINRFTSVNNIEGLYNYSVADLVFNDFVDRGDPRKAHPLGYIAHNWFGDYMAVNITFNRPNVQNRNQGINLIYGYAMNRDPYTQRGNSNIVRDGYFCNNVYDIRFSQAVGSSQLDGPYTHTLINNRHCAQSQTWVAFEGPLLPFQTKPIVVQVEDFQGNPADDFRVYNAQTAPADATTRPKILDKVVGGTGGGGTDPDDDGDGVGNSVDKCPGTAAGTPVDPNGCPIAQTIAMPTTSTITTVSGPTTITNGQQLWKFQSVEGPAGTWQTALWGTDTFRFNVTVVPGTGPLPVILMLHGAGGPNGPKEPQEVIDTTTPGIYVNPVSIWYVNGGIDPLTGTSRGEDWWMGYADSNGIFQPVTADRVVRYVQWVLTQTAKWTPDPNRVYVIGGSMGGGGAQKIALLNPMVFAAGVGVTGWIDLNAWTNGSYCKPGMAWRTSTGPLCTNMHDSIYLVANATGRKVPLFLTWGSNDTLINPARYPELLAMLEARQHPYAAEWNTTGHGYFQIAGDPHLAQRLDVAPGVVAPSGSNPADPTGSRTNLGSGPPPPPPPPSGLTVEYLGPQRDLVQPGRTPCASSPPPCDGVLDPQFRLTFSTFASVTRVRLTASGQAWDTEPPDAMLGVTDNATSPLMNPTGPVSAAGSELFVYAAGTFAPGTVVTVTATTSAGTVSGTVTVPGQPPPPDTTKPLVTLTVPASPLKDTVTITATCADNVGCVSVQLVIDGTAGATDTTAPYGFGLDTKTLANTSHTFSVIGRDAAGNQGTLVTPETRTVDNTTPPPPDPCTATPLTVTVSSWPSPNAGSRQFRYTASQAVVSFTLDLNLTRAVFRDTRGCQATVTK